MDTATMVRAAALGAAIAIAHPAVALVIGGGGSKATDCLVALQVDANFPLTDPRQVRCTDGDPTCDDDGLVNGACALRVAICVNSTFNPACTLSGVNAITVEHALDNGDAKFDPDFQALQTRIGNDLSLPETAADTCTGTAIIRVPIKGPFGNNNACGRQKKKVTLRSVSTAGPAGIKEDKDTLKLYCAPAPANGCDPQTLFTGTFDRIQRQGFNQSCALSGCHDSQTTAAGLLLETGAAYTNLVGVTPVNFAAGGAGWLRVDAGHAETSFILHKLEGHLPDASFGARMPLGRPKLHKTLRDIIRLWIEAGAPPTTWVPDTF